MNDFLLQFNHVYHVTHPKNRESIETHGLVPQQTTANAEHSIAAIPSDPAQICFCLEQDVASYVDQERGWGIEPIVCEIRTEALRELRIGLDWTMDGTNWLLQELNEPQFTIVQTPGQQNCALESLRNLRTLVCFDVIPASALKITEGSDFAGQRQQTFEEWLRATDPKNPRPQGEPE